MARLIVALIAFAAVFLLPAAQADEVEVLELRYRTPDQVIPILQPLVEPGGALTGIQNSLIIRSSRRNIEQIRQVLASIDTLPRKLMISVRQDAAGSLTRRGAGASGTLSNRGSDVAVRVEDSSGTGFDSVSQQVQALEGSPAYISTGQSVPVQSTVIINGVVQSSGGVQNYATGFYVVPRVSGSRVNLEISTTRDRPVGVSGAARTQGIVTTASGRLGEWFELGGIGQSSASSERDLASGREVTRTGTRSVWVKVD